MKVNSKLKEIAPMSYEAILNAKHANNIEDEMFGVGLDFSEPACCIVGEAHGRTRQYFGDEGEQEIPMCIDCKGYSIALYQVAVYREPFYSNDVPDHCIGTDFKDTLDKFIEHFEKQHLSMQTGAT